MLSSVWVIDQTVFDQQSNEAGVIQVKVKVKIVHLFDTGNIVGQVGRNNQNIAHRQQIGLAMQVDAFLTGKNLNHLKSQMLFNANMPASIDVLKVAAEKRKIPIDGRQADCILQNF